MMNSSLPWKLNTGGSLGAGFRGAAGNPRWQDGGTVQQRLPSLLPAPIAFAHRGARADAPENTLSAFQLALDKGASGLESDVWLTADGIPVLDHDGLFGRRRKQPIAGIRRRDLPPHVPELAELIEQCGGDYHLSLDIKDPAATAPVLDCINDSKPDLIPRTWLCHHDVELLAAIRDRNPLVRLVNSTRIDRLGESIERRAARLAALGIDAINLRKETWNGGLVALFHRFERAAFAWDVQFEHELQTVFRIGIDAVYSDFVDRMMSVYASEVGSSGAPA
jgi:glycerophosphoryl diester phosphodiesterase